MRQAGGAEVAFESRAQPRVVAQRQPEQQPRLARRERRQDRPAGECSERLRPPDGGERGRAEALGLVNLELGRDPAPQQELGEPTVLDRPDRAGDPQDVAADRVRRSLPAGEPDGLADGCRALGPRDRSHVEDRRPPVELGRGVRAERALDRDVRRRDPGDDRPLDAVLVHLAPPNAEEERPDERDEHGGNDRAAAARGRESLDGIGALAFEQASALERWIARAVAWSARDGGREQERAAEQPHPRVRECPDPRLRQQARPQHGGERGRDPRAHTVTSSRMSSSVASPIPLTSSSWSTDVKGPFSVR
jgi:hypothetical protein